MIDLDNTPLVITGLMVVMLAMCFVYSMFIDSNRPED